MDIYVLSRRKCRCGKVSFVNCWTFCLVNIL